MKHDLLTIEQAADIIGVHPRTLTRWVTDGALKAVRLPSGRYRIQRADLDAFLTPTLP